MKKRLLICIVSFIVIYVFNFFIPRLIPGDPFTVGDAGEVVAQLTPEQIEEMRAYYGLDKPLHTQFFETIRNNLSGNLGMSIFYKKPVAEILSSRIPWTLYIMLTTITLSLVFGVLLAFISTRKKKLDTAIFTTMSAFGETPSFLIGVLFLFLIAAKVSWIPISGGATAFAKYANVGEQIGDIVLHSLMPISAMVCVTTPSFYFVSRSTFLSIHQKKYMTNAKAKGLSESRIRIKYLLFNSVLPITSRAFLSVGKCVGETLLVEIVFAYPGLGKILQESVKYRDYMLIQGVFLLSAVIVLLSMLISDTIDYLTKRRTSHE